MPTKTLFFTGGHHNCALILAKYFQKKSFNIIWLGARFTSSSNQNLSKEYIDVVNAGIKFIELKAGKYHHSSPLNFFKNISCFFTCYSLFAKYKPKAVFSFGGYLSVAPVLAGFFNRIPCFGHEQTTTLGKANSFLLPFYKKFFLTWPNSKLEKKKKIIRVGMPSQSKFPSISKLELNQILKNNKLGNFENLQKPLILISGGKQGSQIINQTIEKDLEYLLVHYNIFHQTGNNSTTKDFKRLSKKRGSLPSDLRNSYIVCDYSHEFSSIVSASDLVIGRSGAHTVFEILHQKKKLIAIPLPFAYANEQYKNASVLVDLGLGKIIKQKNLDTQKLRTTILKMFQTEVDYTLVDSYILQNFSMNSQKLIYDNTISYLSK